jgi:hypothetical protein
MYPGKELDSLEIAIYSFYFRCDCNFKRRAKSKKKKKTFVDLATAKFIIP